MIGSLNFHDKSWSSQLFGLVVDVSGQFVLFSTVRIVKSFQSEIDGYCGRTMFHIYANLVLPKYDCCDFGPDLRNNID